MRSSLRQRAVPAVVALVLGAVLLGSTAAVAADNPLTGHVYLGDSAHPALPGQATVTLEVNGTTGASTTVGSDGSWTLPGTTRSVDSNLVRVHYSGGGPYVIDSTRQIIPQLATDITIPRTYTLSGHVYLGSASTPAPLGGARIAATATIPGPGAPLTTTTGADGSWSLSGVQGGDSLILTASWIGMSGSWRSTQWTAPPCTYLACPVTVSADRTGLDIVMPRAGSISGTVTRNGAAVSGDTVYADRADADGGDDPAAGSATTDERGRYEIDGLSDGAYSVYFSDPLDSIADEIYSDRNPYLAPDVVHVAGDWVTGVDADLVAAASISGSVIPTGLTTADLADVTVDLAVLDPRSGEWVDADDPQAVESDGTYDLGGLFPGTYRITAEYDGVRGSSSAVSSDIVVAPGGSASRTLRLSVVRLPSGPPRGALDSVSAGPSSITLSGWALDPDTADPITVHVYVDGAVATALTADGDRPDIAASYPGYGAEHGFATTLTAMQPGTHTVCVYGIDQGATAPSNTQLGCRSVAVPSGRVIGSVDSIRVLPGAIVITGWMLDPVSNRPVTAFLSGGVDGGIPDWDTSVVADRARPDVAAAYPGYGSAHGFVLVAHPGAGKRYFLLFGRVPSDVVATQTLFVQPTGIPAARYDVPAANPFGSLDSAQQDGPGGVRVSGWTLDTDAISPLGVHIYVDGRFSIALSASGTRSDIDAAYPGFSGPHGFSGTLSGLTTGSHTVCAYGINQGGGGNALLGCRAVVARGGSPIGALDYVQQAGPGAIVASGWSLDPDSADPSSVHVYVDGRLTGVVDAASAPRPDIAAAFPGWGATHGYAPIISGLAAGPHTVCTYGINAPGSAGGNSLLGCRSVRVPGGSPVGSLDSAISAAPGSLTVSGWAADLDTDASISIHVYVDGAFRTAATADGSRPDLVAALGPGYGTAHGFSTSVPGLSRGPHLVCVYGIDVGPGGNAAVGCRTAVVG